MNIRWLVFRLVIRNFQREWGRTLLAIFSVSLGVSVFLAIRLANRSAVASFTSFTQGVGQGSDYSLRAPVGSIEEELIQVLHPIRSSIWTRPILEASFALHPTLESFQILGTDLIGINDEFETYETPTEENRPQSTLTQGALEFYESIQTPNGIFITSTLAETTKIKRGGELKGYINDQLVVLKVVGILNERQNRPRNQRNLLVMDLPALQTLLGRVGEVDRIDIGIKSHQVSQDTENRLRSLLRPSLILEPAEQRATSARTMSSAFRFNLTILSLIALAVGGYLLFQSFDSTVNRRREIWATLNALGTPPKIIQKILILEALILGTLGSLLGTALGWILAQGSVKAISQTMDLLYGASSAHQAQFYWDEFIWSVVVGVLICLLAAWIPARKAALSRPIQFLSRGSETKPIRWIRILLGGIFLTLLGLCLAYGLEASPGVAWHAYIGSFLLIGGGSLVAVGFLPLFGLLGKISNSWWIKLAFRPLLRPTGRHAFASAALAVAVGMAVGMGVMVKSFEGTVQAWIGTSLYADLYIAPLGAIGAASKHRLDESTANRIAQYPFIEAIDRFQIVPIEINKTLTFIGAGDLEVELDRRAMVMIKGGDTKKVFQDLIFNHSPESQAIISETFSRRFGIQLNQNLVIPTPSGSKNLKVRGIFADYGNERGSIIIHRPVFTRWFHDSRLASLAIYLNPGVNVENVAEQLSRDFPGLQARSNYSLREEVRRIFRQTFAITYALEIIGCLVAILGLVQGQLGLALQRRNEIWSLRSLGASTHHISTLLVLEGLGLAFAGILGGILLGFGLAQILVDVLNPQVFGWTLMFIFPWSYVVGVVFLLLVASTLALIPIALWSAKLQADRKTQEGA